MNALILQFLKVYLTDENLRKLILPYKAQIVAKLEDAAKESPEVWDDFAVKVLKIILSA